MSKKQYSTFNIGKIIKNSSLIFISFLILINISLNNIIFAEEDTNIEEISSTSLTVSFQYGNGITADIVPNNMQLPPSYTVEHGDEVDEPELSNGDDYISGETSFVHNGVTYTFLGWFTKENLLINGYFEPTRNLYNFDSEVHNDINIYAHFTKTYDEASNIVSGENNNDGILTVTQNVNPKDEINSNGYKTTINYTLEGEPQNEGKDYIVVIDRSTSMLIEAYNKTRWNHALSATEILADNILGTYDQNTNKNTNGNRMALVYFDGRSYSVAHDVEESVSFRVNKEDIIKSLNENVNKCKEQNGYGAGGVTFYSSGLTKAIEYAENSKQNNRELNVIFISDGAPTAGHEGITEADILKNEYGATIHTLGIALFDDSGLEAINSDDGVNLNITDQNIQDLDMYLQEIYSNTNLVAKDIEFKTTINDKFIINRVYDENGNDLEYILNNNNLTVNINEVGINSKEINIDVELKSEYYAYNQKHVVTENTSLEFLEIKSNKNVLYNNINDNDENNGTYQNGLDDVVVSVKGTIDPKPTPIPTIEPTIEPTVEPTIEPTIEPTVDPTIEPTVKPTIEPTVIPTVEPTIEPTVKPTIEPTIEPTVKPTIEPTIEPTVKPTIEPTVIPTIEPTIEPTPLPTKEPIEEVIEEEETPEFFGSSGHISVANSSFSLIIFAAYFAVGGSISKRVVRNQDNKYKLMSLIVSLNTLALYLVTQSFTKDFVTFDPWTVIFFALMVIQLKIVHLSKTAVKKIETTFRI